MEVMNNKELQNDMRNIVQTEKGTGLHCSADEALITAQIISGKIKKGSDLNNIHYMVGLLPPSI